MNNPPGRNNLSRMRWVMIGFAFAATVLNYLHRLSFTYLSTNGYLRNLIPDKEFGYIGAAFMIAYLISNGVSGFVIDKLGVRLGYALCMAFWTTAGLLHAVARTPFQFGFFRFMLGLGEAGNWPAAIKLSGEWFSAEERSTASGIFNSGASIGAIVAPLLTVWLGRTFGWQMAFVVIGLIGYLWVAAFWFTYYTPEQAVKESKTRSIPPLMLLKNRFVRNFALAHLFTDPVWYFITFWIGRYLTDVHKWDLGKIMWFAMIPFIVADFGNILGGLFTQFIIKKGVPIERARKLSVFLFGSLLAIALMLGPLMIRSPYSALAVMAIAGFGYAAFLANSMAFPADVVPLNATASVWGIAGVGAGLGGAVFQALSGYAVQELSHHFNYFIAYNTVFIGYGAMALLGMVIMVFLTGPLTPDKALDNYSIGLSGHT